MPLSNTDMTLGAGGCACWWWFTVWGCWGANTTEQLARCTWLRERWLELETSAFGSGATRGQQERLDGAGDGITQTRGVSGTRGSFGVAAQGGFLAGGPGNAAAEEDGGVQPSGYASQAELCRVWSDEGCYVGMMNVAGSRQDQR